MKSAVLLLALGLCLNAFAQTSSRFRNEVETNVGQHFDRIERTCTDIASRLYNAQPDVELLNPQTWLYKYETFYLDRCYLNTKIHLSNTHIQLARVRISRLTQQARDRRDEELMAEVRGLQRGVTEFIARQARENKTYTEAPTNWRGPDGRRQMIRREIRRILEEYYEMRAEMRFEGTL